MTLDHELMDSFHEQLSPSSSTTNPNDSNGFYGFQNFGKIEKDRGLEEIYQVLRLPDCSVRVISTSTFNFLLTRLSLPVARRRYSPWMWLVHSEK